jgi:hypothetical protein
MAISLKCRRQNPVEFGVRRAENTWSGSGLRASALRGLGLALLVAAGLAEPAGATYLSSLGQIGPLGADTETGAALEAQAILLGPLQPADGDILLDSGSVWLLDVTDLPLLDAGRIGLTITPVPEPSTAVMFGMGLVGLAWAGRRQGL